jgi:hypothetical protein
MITMFFKFSIAFVISFVILSFSYDGQPVFYHVTQFTGPLGSEVQKSLGKSVKRSFSKSKKIGKDLFENADPKYFDDAINSQQSSLNGKKDRELILEDIRKDEAKKLDELIKKN